MKEGNKITGKTIIPLVCIAIWIMILNAIIMAFQIPHGWTIFIATIFFFNMGASKKALPEIFIGGVIGLAGAWLFIIAAGLMIPSFGHLAGAIVPLTIVVFALIILHPLVPVVFNNVAFTYLIISTIQHDKVLTETFGYIIVFLIGGAIAVGGCMLIIDRLTKMEKKRIEAINE